MREVVGNLWDFYDDYFAHVAITTNGSVTNRGLAVLGRGVALEARGRFPTLPKRLGAALRAAYSAPAWPFDDVPLSYFSDLRLFAFPVKLFWPDPADPALIIRSAERLMAQIDQLRLPAVYTVRPGCGNGRQDWTQIKPLIDPVFDDRITIVQR